MTKTDDCAHCAYFEEHQLNNTRRTDDDAGLCRFNPPITQPAPDAAGLWPVVKSNDWCGHFETAA